MHKKFLAAGGSVPIRAILVRKVVDVALDDSNPVSVWLLNVQEIPLVLGRPSLILDGRSPW